MPLSAGTAIGLGIRLAKISHTSEAEKRPTATITRILIYRIETCIRCNIDTTIMAAGTENGPLTSEGVFMRITEKEMAAVMRLPGPARYEYFVKRVVDAEEAWGLYREGWALAGAAEGQVFPLWPAREYAAQCATADWAGYEPSAIPLEDLVDELIPKLKSDGVLVGVFYTPTGKGVTPEWEQLLGDLQNEMRRYE